MKLLSPSSETTKKIAEFLAKEIKRHKSKSRRAFVIGLLGDLGSGKTTFIQGFARGLGVKHNITSPTFLIIRSYKLKNSHYKLFYHIDIYRIKKPKELLMLDFKKIVTSPKNIVIIEWVDKIKRLLPFKILFIKLKHSKHKNERIIKFYINK